MSLKANYRKHPNGNITIFMEGSLEFGTNQRLQTTLNEIKVKHPRSQIYLDFSEMEFVGSSSINTFVDFVGKANGDTPFLILQNVSPEFKRVFKLYSEEDLDMLIRKFDNNEEIIISNQNH